MNDTGIKLANGRLGEETSNVNRRTAATQWIAQDPGPCTGIEPVFVFGDEVNSEQRELIRQSLLAGIRYVCSNGDIGASGLSVYAFADLERISDAYAQWFDVPVSQARDAWVGGRSAISGPKVLFLYMGNSWLSSALASSDLRSLVELLSHEYFHVVQWNLAGQDLIGVPDNEVPIGGPRWLIEGAAAYVGSLSVDEMGLYSYGSDKREKKTEAMLTSATLSSLESSKGLSAAGDAGHKLGFLASDLLIPDSELRSTGVRSFLALWDSVGKGKNWREAFQTGFGRTIENFYEQFSDARTRLFPPLTTQPFTIIFDGTFPSGSDVAQDAPPGYVPYVFRVTGFDLASLTPSQLDSAFRRPEGTSWGGARMGRDLLVLYLLPSTQSGTYSAGLDLPDGRHAETTFKHAATSGGGIDNPSPTLISLVPSQGRAGDAGFLLTIVGKDFVNGALVQLNGSKRTAKLRSSTELELPLTGNDIAVAGVIGIGVSNPGPGGGLSNTQTLTLGQDSSNPVITAVSISGKKLIVSGGGFSDGAKILLDGEVQKKTANAEQNPTNTLIGKKAGKLIALGETVVITVRNSDGSLSNGFSFTRAQ